MKDNTLNIKHFTQESYKLEICVKLSTKWI